LLLGRLLLNNGSVFFFRAFLFGDLLGHFFLFNLLLLGGLGSNDGDRAVGVFFGVLRDKCDTSMTLGLMFLALLMIVEFI
jgi:hypothetical protein